MRCASSPPTRRSSTNRSSQDSGCLVLDLKLPDRDGLAVLAELRSRGVTMPAILITSAPTESIRRRAAAARVPIVEKPIFGNGLIDTIRAAFSAA